MLYRLAGWLWLRLGSYNWLGLYNWLGDTLQKVGIVGVGLALYQDSLSGLFIGLFLLGLSAAIVLSQGKKE